MAIEALKKANPNMKPQDILRRAQQLEEEKKYWAKEEERKQRFIENQQKSFQEKESFDVQVLK